MASPSRSFSALLNSSTASGLRSDYPGQAYRFNEKHKAYLDAKFPIGQATGKKLDGDIVVCEMRRALGPDGVCLFKLKSQSFTANLVLLLASCSQDPPTTSQWCRYQGKQTSRQLCSSKGNCHCHYTPASHHLWSVQYLRHGQGSITGPIKTEHAKKYLKETGIRGAKLIRRKRVWLEKAVKNCTCHESVD